MVNYFKLLLIIIGAFFCPMIIAQTTYYYKLTKSVKNGVASSNVTGGQFVSFCNNVCYESDAKGNQVNESRMDYQYTEKNLIIFYGMSYWGINTTFFFTTDKSKLSVRTNKGEKYVYERTSAPTGVLTSSLIRERRSSDMNLSQPVTPIIDGGYGLGDNSSEYSKKKGTVPKQQYTKTCDVCHGTGTCNNCGGKGRVTRMGMGKDGPCPVCPNHNGRCSSCGGRGSWKQ